MPNDPATHLSGLGQIWRPMHLIAFSEGAYEQHCPKQVKSLLMTRHRGAEAHKLIRLLLGLRSSHSGSLRRRRNLN